MAQVTTYVLVYCRLGIGMKTYYVLGVLLTPANLCQSISVKPWLVIRTLLPLCLRALHSSFHNKSSVGLCLQGKTKFVFQLLQLKVASRALIHTSIEPSTSFTTSGGSFEGQIDALKSFFDLQKLKTNFVFARKNEIRFLVFVAQN